MCRPVIETQDDSVPIPIPIAPFDGDYLERVAACERRDHEIAGPVSRLRQAGAAVTRLAAARRVER